MRILCITDIHSEVGRFEKILANEPRADLLIIGGDFTNFGKPPEVDHLLNLAQAHTRGVRIGDIGFFGVSAMPPWKGTMYEFPEEDLARFLAASYAQVESSPRFILVPHCPPHNSEVDRNASGVNVGSTAVRSWVDKVKPILVVCGHIHEARGQAKVSDTVVVNCGPAKNGNYAVAEVGNEVKVELKRV